MAEQYPETLHCRFEGFPARVRLTCGPGFDRLPECPYSFGSRVVCSRTPLCGALQGTLVPGAALPRYEMLYSDTGQDGSFSLKIAFYGRGTFYAATTEDAFLSLAVVKGLRLEAPGLRKVFETSDVWETRLPVGSDLSGSASLAPVLWREDAAEPGRFATVFVLGAASGTGVISGRTELGGAVSLFLSGGAA